MDHVFKVILNIKLHLHPCQCKEITYTYKYTKTKISKVEVMHVIVTSIYTLKNTPRISSSTHTPNVSNYKLITLYLLIIEVKNT